MPFYVTFVVQPIEVYLCTPSASNKVQITNITVRYWYMIRAVTKLGIIVYINSVGTFETQEHGQCIEGVI